MEREQVYSPETMLDHYHMSENRFKEFLGSKFEERIEFSEENLSFKHK